MIYSRSAEYAIRAFTYLARVPKGQYVMAKQIAEEIEVPGHFLAKILQKLARDWLLSSNKGPTGGFRLRIPAEETSLMKIVVAIDGSTSFQRCASGLAECNDQMPCGMHDSWVALRSRIIDYLENTSVADVARAQEEKERMLARKVKRRAASKKA